MINRTIRNFQIKELLATGGMAAIYKAVQISLDRIVAIKILHGHLAHDKNFIIRFEREAKAAASLKHENIVNIIDYGQADDMYFIAMEYVEGKSLHDLIESLPFIPHDIALRIAYDICQGLHHAHQKGVVHRDIKPANILISNDGIVKITDFGLAQAQDLTSITVTGSIVGTPAYMSPEQAAGRKVDQRSDIFSAGAIIYEMMTGSKPFKGKTYSATIHEILTVVPATMVDTNPLVPKTISDIVEKMLEKDLDKRYQAISEVGSDISSYLKKHNVEPPRAAIAEFVAASADDRQRILQKRKEQHFTRGLHLMTLGYEKIDDAMSEFQKVLHLDPENSQAKKYLSQLQQQKEKQAPVQKTKKTASKRNILLPLGIITIVIIGVLLAIAIRQRLLRLTPTKQTPARFGAVVIRSQPAGAAIYLDDNDCKLITPAHIDSIAVGIHTIELKKTGFKPFVKRITIRPGKTVSLHALLTRKIANPRSSGVMPSYPFTASASNTVPPRRQSPQRIAPLPQL
jgi:serine/threonine protein kinase